MLTLRDYQTEGFNGIRNLYYKVKRVLYVLPCGGGKTLIFGAVAHGLTLKRKRSYILVHRQELLRQASNMLRTLGVPHGVMSGLRKRSLHEPIIVATVQTLVRNLGKLEPPDMIVCDEAHRSVSPSYNKIFEHWPNAFVLGVTASPKRLDGKSLGFLYHEMICGPSVKQLIDRGFLSDFIAYAPPHTPDLSEVAMKGADYDAAALELLFDTPKLIGDAVQHYRRHANGLPAIAFCVSVKAAEDVAAAFNAEGYKAVSVDGEKSEAYRRDALDGLASGKYHVVTSCDLISEGIDVPACAAAILLRPTKSVALAIQQMGRALRPVYAHGLPLDTNEERLAAIAAGPKPRAVILDHAGMIKEHGFPDDDQQWSLQDGPKKKRKGSTPNIRMRHCPECEAIHKPMPECPRCGYVYETFGREVEQVDGELVEMTSVDRERIRMERKSAINKARTEDQLQAVAKKYGYKPGWVHYMLKARGAKSVRRS